MSETRHGGSPRRGALIAVYFVAVAGGYWLGVRGLLRSAADDKDTGADALARVGLALREDSPRADPAAWVALRADIEASRATFPPPQRGAFDLVIAVRGLENGGQPEWSRAEEQCRSLHWSRCDRATLEELRKRSRP